MPLTAYKNLPPTIFRARFSITLDGHVHETDDGLYVLAKEHREHVMNVMAEAIRLIELATLRYPSGFTEQQLLDATTWLKDRQIDR